MKVEKDAMAPLKIRTEKVGWKQQGICAQEKEAGAETLVACLPEVDLEFISPSYKKQTKAVGWRLIANKED